RRSTFVCWQRRHMLLVMNGDFGGGVWDEVEPSAQMDRAADRGAEPLDEEVLIANRPPRGGEDPVERDSAMAKIELEPKLLQEMRAEEKIHLELFLAADQKSHLVVGHHRHRNVGDRHRSELQ